MVYSRIAPIYSRSAGLLSLEQDLLSFNRLLLSFNPGPYWSVVYSQIIEGVTYTAKVQFEAGGHRERRLGHSQLAP